MKKTLFTILIFFFAAFALAFPPTPPAPPALSASETQAGSVELATDAETVTGTDTTRATTPANITAKMAAPGAIGGTTPAAGTFSPAQAKGPAIINSGFAGTVTAAASTTVTFSSAADAILAGYSATNPIVGTTLISNALTRYIVSWTNATTCVVNSSVTWAGTEGNITKLLYRFGNIMPKSQSMALRESPK